MKVLYSGNVYIPEALSKLVCTFVRLPNDAHALPLVRLAAIGNMIDLAGEEIDFGVKRDCLEVMSYLCAGFV